MLYEDNFYIDVKPAYLLDESNSFFKEKYPFDQDNPD
jgi:hypothetical protein